MRLVAYKNSAAKSFSYTISYLLSALCFFSSEDLQFLRLWEFIIRMCSLISFLRYSDVSLFLFSGFHGLLWLYYSYFFNVLQHFSCNHYVTM